MEKEDEVLPTSNFQIKIQVTDNKISVAVLCKTAKVTPLLQLHAEISENLSKV